MTSWAGPEQFAGAVVELRRRFPAATVWYGRQTGSWWAMVECGGWRLVEALSPGELGRALQQPVAWPWPNSVDTARGIRHPSENTGMWPWTG